MKTDRFVLFMGFGLVILLIAGIFTFPKASEEARQKMEIQRVQMDKVHPRYFRDDKTGYCFARFDVPGTASFTWVPCGDLEITEKD